MATESANAAGAGARKPVVVTAAAAPVGFMDDDEGLCELLYRHFCFWRCERDYCFAEGSKCARARDACCWPCPASAKTSLCGTSREREIASYEDELERKEFLGTLTVEEARALKRRRADAALFLRRRLTAEAPETQVMTTAVGAAGGDTRRVRLWKGTLRNAHADDASVVEDDAFAYDETAPWRERRARRSERYDGPDSRPEASEYSSYSDDSYGDDSYGDDSYGDDSYGDDSYGDDSYSSYSSYVSSEDEESIRARLNHNGASVRMDELGNELIVGRDLAYATEGLLGPGLTRWENYIAAAETAGELHERKLRRRAEIRDRDLNVALQNLDRIAESKKISDQDLEVRRAALVAAHESRVRDALERERRRDLRRRHKRNLAAAVEAKRAHARRHRRNLAANAQTR